MNNEKIAEAAYTIIREHKIATDGEILPKWSESDGATRMRFEVLAARLVFDPSVEFTPPMVGTGEHKIPETFFRNLVLALVRAVQPKIADSRAFPRG